MNTIGREGAERALQESEATAQAVLEAIVDAVITIVESRARSSRSTRPESGSSATRRRTWRSRGDVADGVAYRETYEKLLAHDLATGEHSIVGIGREVVGQRKDGTTFPMELSISEVTLAGGRLFTALARDVADRKRMEEQLTM